MTAAKLRQRLQALEQQQRATPRRIAWPSLEAAAAAGAVGGILVIDDVMAREEWEPLAKRQQAELIAGGAHGPH